MKKLIKFNLHVDGQTVRTLEELRNHFNIDDIYDAFQSGMLERWLLSRGYKNEADALSNVLRNSRSEETIGNLIRIFRKDADSDYIAEATLCMTYKEKRENDLKLMDTLSRTSRQHMLSEMTSYKSVLSDIVRDRDDFARVKEHVRHLLSDYGSLFCLEYMRFWDTMIYAAPLAIFAVIMNPQYRSLFLPDQEWDDSLGSRADSDTAEPIFCPPHLSFGQMIDQVLPNTSVALECADKECISAWRHAYIEDLKCLFEYKYKTCKVGGVEIRLDGDNYFTRAVKIVRDRSATEHWDDIEPTESKQYMILYMSPPCQIRSYGCRRDIMTGDQVTGKYPILHGIEYVCANKSSTLIYMEV